MQFTVELEHTPRSPIDGMPFTEESFHRSRVPFILNVDEVGIALVDLWNFGWEDGPFDETLGDRSFERGRSHAERKRTIVKETIAPTVEALQDAGLQIFHCNHGEFMKHFPQWDRSTTAEERRIVSNDAPVSQSPDRNSSTDPDAWPPPDWVDAWKSQHRELVWRMEDWANLQARLYWEMSIPKPVEPRDEDLLVYSRDQFHRLLAGNGIRVLFYMGFETDECLMHAEYGITNMWRLGYLPVVVRDCTATYEAAETLAGLWKTKTAILDIEGHRGYSVTSESLVKSVLAVQ